MDAIWIPYIMLTFVAVAGLIYALWPEKKEEQK